MHLKWLPDTEPTLTGTTNQNILSLEVVLLPNTCLRSVWQQLQTVRVEHLLLRVTQDVSDLSLLWSMILHLLVRKQSSRFWLCMDRSDARVVDLQACGGMLLAWKRHASKAAPWTAFLPLLTDRTPLLLPYKKEEKHAVTTTPPVVLLDAASVRMGTNSAWCFLVIVGTTALHACLPIDSGWARAVAAVTFALVFVALVLWQIIRANWVVVSVDDRVTQPIVSPRIVRVVLSLWWTWVLLLFVVARWKSGMWNVAHMGIREVWLPTVLQSVRLLQHTLQSLVSCMFAMVRRS